MYLPCMDQEFSCLRWHVKTCFKEIVQFLTMTKIFHSNVDITYKTMANRQSKVSFDREV